MNIILILWDNILDKLIGVLISVLYFNRTKIYLFIQSLTRWNKDVRFSIAYLYQINFDNKYLLIQGHKIPGQYQPIGGVFKVLNSFSEVKNKYQIIFDDESRFYDDGDLRFETKGKHVQNIIKWFNSKKNREVNVIREFYEELIETELLKSNCLFELKFEFLNKIESKIEYSEHFQKYEVKIFEIYNVILPEDIKQEIRQLIEQDNEKLKLVSADEIQKKCFTYKNKSYKISEHSKYIL